MNEEYKANSLEGFFAELDPQNEPKSLKARTGLTPGEMFNRYKIGQELGHGGMGVVYKAYDTKLGNYVALKIILGEETGSAERFLREASATARLNHPNIVRFYEVGNTPKPYFTMEYIDGISLADLIKEKKIKSPYLVEITIKLCEALAVAHKNKILHRDIKPSNIMITKQGEPKIMDFGLAKLTKDSLQQISRSNEPLGTLLYMSPEQIKGNANEKSDIYSIGATIYEAMTYRPIFQSNNQMNLVYQIFHDLPIPPRELNPDISPYLEAICLKCTSKKPGRRYSNFKQLAREFKNLKAHKPLIVRKYSRFDKVKNLIAKNKLLFGFVLIVLLICLAFILALINMNNQLHKERNQANELAANTAKAIEMAISKHQSLLQDQEYLALFDKILVQTDTTRFKKLFQMLKGLKLGRTSNEGDWPKSIEEYNDFIANNPQNAKTYINRGDLYTF